MSKYKLTLREQETIILYNQGEKDVEIYTHDPTLIKKLKEHPDVAILKRTNNYGGYTYIVPKKEIIIRMRNHYTGEKRERLLKHINSVNEQNKSRNKENSDESNDNTPPQKIN